jgi:hypothetical protein
MSEDINYTSVDYTSVDYTSGDNKSVDYTSVYLRKIQKNIKFIEDEKNIPFESKPNIKLNKDVKIEKKSYEESDLNKLLSILLAKDQKDFRIVCHSNIMRKFLKDTLTKVSKQITKLSDEQNLWTLFFTCNEKKISVSRHAYSYANTIKNKGDKLGKLPLDKLKKKLGKLQQASEKDPGLTIYGILSSLYHGSKLVENEIKNGLTSTPSTIYVSILIRTWMTAICLYLPHVNNDDFTLIISPFIKEEGIPFFSNDNYPNKIDEQIIEINKFLEFLTDIDINIIKNEVIKDNIKKIKTFFNDGHTVNIFYFDDVLKNDFNNVLKNDSNKNLSIENNKIIIFPGFKKPNKEILKKVSRWCEPFSSKKSWTMNLSLKKPTCKDKINAGKDTLSDLYILYNKYNKKEKEIKRKLRNKNKSKP